MDLEYYPIGTVIQPKDSDLQFMIIGYNYKKDGKTYDYITVIHPVGITYRAKNVDMNAVAYNHEDIDKVYAIGYMDKDVNDMINHNKNISISRKKREENKK